LTDTGHQTQQVKTDLVEPGTADASKVGSPYARYVLFVLVLIYTFNFVDRQILSILANDIKADLGISDAEIGFLYGTAFAVFYAIFGIPFGRLSDVWVRRRIIAYGLGFWSLMTALSGTARSFTMLAVYRFGVGIGEASASPAAFSMLADYFKPSQRATVMAIYSSGVYIGGGVAYLVGGPVLDGWNNAFPDPATAPFGLRGWHVAFMVVGLPGVLMAFWAHRLKEPIRGMSEAIPKARPRHPHPFRATFNEFLAIFPVINLVHLAAGKASRKMLAGNVLGGLMIALLAFGMYRWLGNLIQWTALGIGLYCAFTWSQSLALRSPDVFSMIFHSPTIMLTILAFPMMALVSYGTGFWIIPYVLRAHPVSATEVGIVMGLSAVIGGLSGVAFGGWLADLLRKRWEAGRLYVGLISVGGAVPTGLAILYAESLLAIYICYFLFLFFKPMYIGPATATVNDLVLPQMRGTVTALYLLAVTFIGLALGPYLMGSISTRLAQGGMDPVEALRLGIEAPFLFYGIASVLVLMACKTIKNDHQRVKDITAAEV
jgi:MFS family permease